MNITTTNYEYVFDLNCSSVHVLHYNPPKTQVHFLHAK